MSTRSKFERQLGFRESGFSYKIPDIGRAPKPFDYVVGVPVHREGYSSLRFVAIEAKKARGWTLPCSDILEHQERALNIVELMAPFSAWLAIGFLDIPKMKLYWDRKPITARLRAEAYLVPWRLVRDCDVSIKYEYIASELSEYAMEYKKVRTAYKWIIGADNPFWLDINPENSLTK